MVTLWLPQGCQTNNQTVDHLATFWKPGGNPLETTWYPSGNPKRKDTGCSGSNTACKLGYRGYKCVIRPWLGVVLRTGSPQRKRARFRGSVTGYKKEIKVADRLAHQSQNPKLSVAN